jgi:hypothetical protein
MYVPRNQLSAPEVCDNCSSPNIGLSSNAVIYGTEKGLWPYCFYCDDCGAVVGCHPNTHKPMGLMANGATRRLRKRVHELFDPIWRLEYLSRVDAYDWLGSQLHLTEECHISHLTKDQLKTAIEILATHNEKDYALFKRRKAKNDSRKFARFRRQDSKIAIRKSTYKPK